MADSVLIERVTCWELAKRIWNGINEDDVFGEAAELAFYFLLGTVPMFVFLTALIGVFASQRADLRNILMVYLSALVPASGSGLLYQLMNEVQQASGGGKLFFGLLAALWSLSTGMSAVIETLNRAHGIQESRSWWKSRLIAIALTIALSLLLIIALVLLWYGGFIGEALVSRFGFPSSVRMLWNVARWLVMIASVLCAFGLVYYFAPNLKRQRLRWVVPGAVAGVVLWLLASWGFRLYLSLFNSFTVTYGSLGAVIILLTWFYATGAAILIGGEVNVELQRAAAAVKESEGRGTMPKA